jgi:hypothetical protein
VRHPDRPQARTDYYPETDVEQRLHQEKSAQPLSRIVQRGSRALQIARTRQSEEAIAQVFPPQEDEQKKENDQPSRCQRR